MNDLIYEGEPAWFSTLANLCIILLGLFVLAFIAWAVYGTIAARRQAAKDVAELTKGITEKERKALIEEEAREILYKEIHKPVVSSSPFSPANRGKRRKENSSGISSMLDDVVDGLTDF